MIISYIAGALILVILIGSWVLYFRASKKHNPYSTQSRTEALRMEEEATNKLKK